MLNTITINGREYNFNLSAPIDISAALTFNGAQPNAYGVEPAKSSPCVSGQLVGDTRQGGSCNFEQYTLIPHCNGTHTECVGHITRERISIRDSLKDVLTPAILISIKPDEASTSTETYSVAADSGDLLITRAALERSLSELQTTDSLVVRTLPNGDDKMSRQYGDLIPPYFTTEAMKYIVRLGVKHLIVDLPSIDRLYDNGMLVNHRIFWNIDQGSFELTASARRNVTITELAYIPNNIEDGMYILNLQIAPFSSDASPSRPILFRVEQK